jgi:hypothetical protein
MLTNTATKTHKVKKRLHNQLLTYPNRHQHKVDHDDLFGSDI